mmetsp:Transcript_18936/g.54852  ORF Transcript_18936/g.54852 Transcript_18936/m.54852 type:complete len:503 (-) Transcript_18936:48-1556(-)
MAPNVITPQNREAVQELPNLMNRIREMGLTEEYLQYRERYLGWRMGGTQGASGELNASALDEKKGWGYWYPTLLEWQWKRTLSYWISITFFEGSLFFTFSSFLGCYADHLGHVRHALTTWGYAAGKVHYFACTYLMCLETINMTNADDTAHGHHHGSKKHARTPRRLRSVDESDAEAEAENANSSTDESSGSSSDEQPWKTTSKEKLKSRRKFSYWPFRYQTALENLRRLGVGPWPYFASAIYFIGVWVFAIGLVGELCGLLPEAVESWVVFVTFLLGSLLFTAGGIFECIENEVFRTLKFDQGYVGAALNTLGGVFFTVGAIMGYWEDLAFEANFAFGVGSLIFACGSGVMIFMWKDEQFGLTFLAVLNNLGNEQGKPMVRQDSEDTKANTFSPRGAVFIMIYSLTATVSVYDFLCVLWDTDGSITHLRLVERAFNALLPCIFAHMMLALNAGVYKTPNIAPFHQLYIACRWIAVIMVLNSTARVIQFIHLAASEKHEPAE